MENKEMYTATLEFIYPNYPADEEWLITGTCEEVQRRIDDKLADMLKATQEGYIRIYRGTSYELENLVGEHSIKFQALIDYKSFEESDIEK